MKKIVILFLTALSSLLVAADSASESARAMTPAEAIKGAAAFPDGMSGMFELVVQSTGVSAGTVLLYSDLDPHDPRCLTIAVSPEAVKEMYKQSRLEPVVDLKGKKIRVYGTASVVRIYSERQTHVWVPDAANLVVVK